MEVNFVAYLVHLYFFVLPIAIGDTYAAMGLYNKASRNIARCWRIRSSISASKRRMFGSRWPPRLQWGNDSYRREQRATAKQKYEFILRTDLTVPADRAVSRQVRRHQATAAEVIKELKRQPHAPVNPQVAAIIAQAAMRLKYLAQNFNFFGIGADYAPVFRFKYLQSAATYMADNAIEAERTFIGYRSTAENQKIEHIQLQSAVDINQTALAIENKRMEDAALEVEAARRTREYAEVRSKMPTMRSPNGTPRAAS